MYIRSDWRKRIILGAAGGFIGTLAIQALLTASQKWLPNTVPPLRQDPGEFMVKTGEEALPEAMRRRIPQVVETGATRMLAVGYGLTFGSLYTLLRPKGGSPFVDPRFKGVGPTGANFALLSLPETRRAQSPRPHTRSDDPPGCHGLPE
jgi:hypothetical protein